MDMDYDTLIWRIKVQGHTLFSRLLSAVTLAHVPQGVILGLEEGAYIEARCIGLLFASNGSRATRCSHVQTSTTPMILWQRSRSAYLHNLGTLNTRPYIISRIWSWNIPYSHAPCSVPTISALDYGRLSSRASNKLRHLLRPSPASQTLSAAIYT